MFRGMTSLACRPILIINTPNAVKLPHSFQNLEHLHAVSLGHYFTCSLLISRNNGQQTQAIEIISSVAVHVQCEYFPLKWP